MRGAGILDTIIDVLPMNGIVVNNPHIFFHDQTIEILSESYQFLGTAKIKGFYEWNASDNRHIRFDDPETRAVFTTVLLTTPPPPGTAKGCLLRVEGGYMSQYAPRVIEQREETGIERHWREEADRKRDYGSVNPNEEWLPESHAPICLDDIIYPFPTKKTKRYGIHKPHPSVEVALARFLSHKPSADAPEVPQRPKKRHSRKGSQ